MLSRQLFRSIKGHKAAVYTSTRAASTVGGILDEATERFPLKEALRSVKQDLRFSFTDLNRLADEFANGLIDLDFENGSRLAVIMNNTAEHVVAQLAAAKAGVTLVAIDAKIESPKDVASILQKEKCRGVLYEPRIESTKVTELVEEAIPDIKNVSWHENDKPFRFRNFPHLQYVITTGQYDKPARDQFRHMFVNGIEEHVKEARDEQINKDTVLMISYKASSDGSPVAGPQVTHGEILDKVNELSNSLKILPSDTACLTKSGSEVSLGVLACLDKNAQVILPCADFDEEAVAHAMKLENCGIIGLDESSFKRV